MPTKTNQSEFDRELLSAYVDGELTDAERAAVEAHLANDPVAQRQVEEFRRVSGLIQNLPRPALPADFSAKVLQRAEQGSSSPQVESQRPTLSIGRTWRGWAWAAAALAAALLVALWLPDPREELARNDVAESSSPPTDKPEMPALRTPAGQVATGETEMLAESDAVGRDEPASGALLSKGKFSVADSSEPDSYSFFGAAPDRSRLLIVRVSMPAEARAGHALEHVLASNGIEVETADEDSQVREEAAMATSSLDRDLSRSIASEDAAETAAAGGVGGAFGGKSEPAEVVLVEAPIEQITACLDTLQNDAANFHTVEIEEESPILQQESPSVDRASQQLRRYNRLAPTTRAKDGRESAVAEAAPPEAAPPEAPLAAVEPPLSASSPEPAAADAARAPPPAPAPRALAAGGEKAQLQQQQLAAKGRAYRYVAPSDGRKRAFDELARRQTVLEKLEKKAESRLSLRSGEAGDPPLQVLFVLQNAPPHLAAPEPAAPEPAAPADTPR